jgi:hypothetical protein
MGQERLDARACLFSIDFHTTGTYFSDIRMLRAR